MLRRVRSYIRQQGLLCERARVLVCVSGGADSVGLLDVLLRGGYECVAAHCNFHLRGEESMRDELFVRELCDKMGVRLLVQDFDTYMYAREQQIGLETAARMLRYRWFGEVAATEGCEAIAVAHHQNDQAETLLLNLLRGTGIRGLCGMRPKANNPYSDNGIPVIRPLLCTIRDYIEYYLRSKRHLPWVNDSTNEDISIPRNAIRAQLAQCRKAEIENLALTAQRMQGYVDMLEGMDTREAGICRLYEELRDYRFPEIDKIYDALQRGVGGKRFESEEYVGVIRHHKLIVERKK